MPEFIGPERLREFGTTIFTEMTALAVRTGALNLGQGFPDSDGPPAVLDVARTAIADGANQYQPLPGRPELRAAVARQRADDYGTVYDPDTEIQVTYGATEAIASAMQALCEPGDEVILFEPYYDSYAAAVAMAGARRRVVPLRPEGDRFVFDPDELRAAAGPRTRAVLLNTPHNPTGKVLDRDELALVADLCVRHDLVAVTDEVYEHLTYDGVEHVPLATLPGMRERTIAVSSAGKTFSVTGWKVGWACGPAHLVTAIRTVKQYLTFAGNGPFQLAVAAGLADSRAWVAQLRNDLRARRDILRGQLDAAGVTTYRTQGTYFLELDVRGFGYDDADAFCRELPERAGVVAIPNTAFCDTRDVGRHLARLAFCKAEGTVTTAASRLAEFAAARGAVTPSTAR